MSAYHLEKNIPLPITIVRNLPPEIRAAMPAVFPFNQMTLWDSFAFAKIKHPKVQNEAFVKGRELKCKFAVSKTELRCWRVK